jgi:hypothetical protein
MNESYRFVPVSLHQSACISADLDLSVETILTNPYSSGQWEDTEDSDEDESDESSIVSKGASEYSDSDYSTGDERQWVDDMEQERRENCIIL